MASLLEYRGYHGTVEYSAEDRCLWGKVIDMSDTLLYEGSSVEEIENEFRCLIDNYIATCEAKGWKADKPFKGTFNVRVAPDLHRKAVIKAAAEQCSLNEVVNNALSRYLEQSHSPSKDERHPLPMRITG